MKCVRRERLDENADILYRPQIVKVLVQQIEDLLSSKEIAGLLVKGPQGVGKSYSLINLTRYLLASGKYWVTILTIVKIGRMKTISSFSNLLGWTPGHSDKSHSHL